MKTANIAVELVDYCGNDLSVVNAARVSFAKVCDKLTSSDEKLIKYLANHGHKSPFNHAFMTFRVKAPIFVARQLVKHKFMPWNEESRRYIKSEPEFYVPSEYRKMSDNVKQGSSDDLADDCEYIAASIKRHAIASLNIYNDLIDSGVCNEQARMVLPQNMMVNWIWSGTLGAVTDMLKLRLDSHAQYETRLVADAIYAIAKELFPISMDALLDE